MLVTVKLFSHFSGKKLTSKPSYNLTLIFCAIGGVHSDRPNLGTIYLNYKFNRTKRDNTKFSNFELLNQLKKTI